jgi:predicted DNA-binding transcriptional regulator AlpA
MKTQSANVEAIQARADSRIRAGDNLLKLSSAATRLDVSMATVWGKIKNDPKFPRPLYDENGMCRIIERELNEYMAARYASNSSGRANRARNGRERIAA